MPMHVNTFDGTPANFLGFKHLFDEFEKFGQTPNYPPHNVIAKINEDLQSNIYLIEIAVAGFKKEQLRIEEQENCISVSGDCAEDKQQSTNGITYVHRGLSQRKFTLKFRKTDNIKVMSTKLENGILSIELEEIKPEKKLTIHEIK